MSAATATMQPPCRDEEKANPVRIAKILLWAAIAVVLLWTLFPFYWAIACSIRTNPDSYAIKFLPWIHFDPTLDGWRQMWSLPEIRLLYRTAYHWCRRRHSRNDSRGICRVWHCPVLLPATAERQPDNLVPLTADHPAGRLCDAIRPLHVPGWAV